MKSFDKILSILASTLCLDWLSIVILDRDFLQFTNHEPNFPWISLFTEAFYLEKSLVVVSANLVSKHEKLLFPFNIHRVN
jgi:hypothetical protein